MLYKTCLLQPYFRAKSTKYPNPDPSPIYYGHYYENKEKDGSPLEFEIGKNKSWNAGNLLGIVELTSANSGMVYILTK